LEIGKLSAAEARTWLGDHPAAGFTTESTLAELVALRDGRGDIAVTAAAPDSGMYL
jgi:hypothetical protein